MGVSAVWNSQYDLDACCGANMESLCHELKRGDDRNKLT